MVYDLSPGLRTVFFWNSCVSCAVVCQFLFFSSHLLRRTQPRHLQFMSGCVHLALG